MGPRLFLGHVVRPNVAELDQYFGDVRRAFNAIASVDALAAQLYVWCQANAPAETARFKRDSDYKDDLAKKCPGFRLVRIVANAQKHVELTQGKKPKEVSSAKQVKVRQVGGRFKGWKPGVWKPGAWGDRPQVIVRTNAGDVRAVRDFVTDALAFIEQEMARLNVS